MQLGAREFALEVRSIFLFSSVIVVYAVFIDVPIRLWPKAAKFLVALFSFLTDSIVGTFMGNCQIRNRTDANTFSTS